MIFKASFRATFHQSCDQWSGSGRFGCCYCNHVRQDSRFYKTELDTNTFEMLLVELKHVFKFLFSFLSLILILNPRLGLAMLTLPVNNNPALFLLPSHNVITYPSPPPRVFWKRHLRIPKPWLQRHHLGNTRFSMLSHKSVVSNKLLHIYTTHIFHLQTSSSAPTPSKLSMLVWAPLKLLSTIFHSNGECNRTGGASGGCKWGFSYFIMKTAPL